MRGNNLIDGLVPPHPDPLPDGERESRRIRGSVGGLIRAAAITLIWVILVTPALAADPASADKRSGYAFMSRDTQAMQDDDTANPGMLWVLEGEALWNAKAGNAGKSCADCHGDAAKSMKGVAARYPAFDAGFGGPVDLEGRVNLCRKDKQNATAFRWESRELLALTAFIGRQSRGVPIEATKDARLAPSIEAGRRIYETRQGQLNLSCANCHDDNAGKRLAGNAVPQAHPTGYPIYRLEWQGLGSLQRRLRNCLTGMRAEAYPLGGTDLINLELYLMQRASGLPVETPAVRP